MSNNKVIIAMSGGVDSSVAAALLKQKGYEVVGVTMRVWAGDKKDNPARQSGGNEVRHACYGYDEDDVEDAKKVAEILNIPFYVFDLQEDYKSEVLDYFYSEYLSGRTPNPCIRCNRRIKFGALVEKIRNSGISFDFIATGHYAITKYDVERGRYLLMKASDLKKDQSYFLFSLSQEQLKLCLFPIGNYNKEEVRKMAQDFKLGIEDKPESQDFVAEGYSSLFKNSIQPGPILNREGQVLGEHQGIQFYTIGQRKGLRLSSTKPLYVIAIDREKNAIIVGEKEDLISQELIASELNWITIPELKQSIKVKAKIRYGSEEVEAEISPLDTDRVYVKFMEQLLAITPGQAVVFYIGDVLLGGGIIE